MPHRSKLIIYLYFYGVPCVVVLLQPSTPAMLEVNRIVFAVATARNTGTPVRCEAAAGTKLFPTLRSVSSECPGRTRLCR